MLLCELAARYVADAGVEVAFGLVGEGNISTMTALQELGVEYVPTRREDGAVSMADGFSRRSGRIGFASVTHGPGLTNALTAMIEAVRRRSPVVVLTAVTEQAALHHAQRVPAQTLVEATGAGWHLVRSSQHLADDVSAAFHDAWYNRRVAVLAFPSELLHVEIDALLLDEELPGALPDPFAHAPAPAAPPPDDVARVAALLQEAQRPLLLAGDGAVRAGARHALERLADSVDGHLATTLIAKGLFSGHPRNVGICGSFSSPEGTTTIQAADVILAVGCTLNPWTTMQGDMVSDATVVHCDLDAAAIGRWFQPDLGIVADGAALIDALLETLGDGADSASSRTESPSQDETQSTGEDATPPFLPMDVVSSLREFMPDDAIVVSDVGHAILDVITHMDVADPSRFVATLHAGSIGLALGAAIGAAEAAEGEWTFLFIGDGALLMSIQELDTLRRKNLAVAVVLLDDGGYGAEVQYCKARGLPETLAHIDTPDIRATVGGFGIPVHAVTSLNDLDVLDDILSGPAGPVVLHVPVNGARTNRWYEQFSASVEPLRGWSGA